MSPRRTDPTGRGVLVNADPPIVQRAHRKACLARALRKSLERYGYSFEATAARLGVSAGKVTRWCSPESGEAISHADVVELWPEVQRELLEAWAAHEGLILTERPEGETIADDYRASAKLTRLTGVLEATLQEALADGGLDLEEGRAIREAGRRTMALIAAWLERLESLETTRAETARRAPTS